MREILFHESWDELSADDQHLLARALDNQKNAYAPYSNFLVGATILLDDGRIMDGFNIENAAYPLCICAERTAIAHALASAPDAKILKLAVVGGNTIDPPFPCGSCRQVMVEMEHRQSSAFTILIGSRNKRVYVATSAGALLPHSFTPQFLIDKT